MSKQWLEVTIAKVLADKPTKNGNIHTALVCRGDPYIQVWDDDAREELENYADIYEGEKVELYVDEKDEGFYWLTNPSFGEKRLSACSAIIPNKHLAAILFEARTEDFEDATTDEEKQELLDEVEAIFS